MDIVSKVSNLIKDAVSVGGYNIDSITYEKEDGVYYLRVIITKNGIITVDDCVTVSRIINPILDDADLIEDNYILDVCSK